MKKTVLISTLALSAVLASSMASATQFTVSVQNLTQGIHFTPLLVAAHNSSTSLFKAGETATASLQAMAEGGSLDGLNADLAGTTAQSVANPAAGLLAPGASATTSMFDTGNTDNDYLSIVGMMLPTNDGFIGLSAYKIPTTAGTYTININGYDAGTEANNELLVPGPAGGAPGNLGIPAAPGGDAGANGIGAAGVDSNSKVHIHRGILGDTDATGGISDLDSRIHRWLNPVARVTITVTGH